MASVARLGSQVVLYVRILRWGVYTHGFGYVAWRLRCNKRACLCLWHCAFSAACRIPCGFPHSLRHSAFLAAFRMFIMVPVQLRLKFTMLIWYTSCWFLCLRWSELMLKFK